MLENLKLMDKDNYNYGISIYHSMCYFFNDKLLINYIDSKYHIKRIDDIYYLNDDKTSFKISKSYSWIKTINDLRPILCLFYV